MSVSNLSAETSILPKLPIFSSRAENTKTVAFWLAYAFCFAQFVRKTGKQIDTEWDCSRLDVGTDHRNPKDKKHIGKLHKHKWTPAYKDKYAYVPDDITAGVNDVVKIWKEFCAEAKITHDGTLSEPTHILGVNQ